MVPEPVGWRCFCAWACRRCSAGAVSLLLTVMAWIVVRAATVMSRTASAKKNVNGSSSPATSLNLQRCRQGKSCLFWPIAGFISVRNAAFTGCCTTTVRFTGGVVHGHHRNQDPCRGSGLSLRTSSGVGTSPTCPPPCEVCGCTSIWSSTSGAARLWRGMSLSEKTQPLQPIWWVELAYASGSAKAVSSLWFCTPTMAMPCVPPRWKAGWKNWACSGLSQDQECPTTTRTPNPCSGQRNIGRTTRDDHLPARMRPVQWVASFADWYNHRHRHSGIKFVTPHERHSGQAVEICRHRAVVYEQARQRNPRRWSRSIRCWRQPEVVWINPPSTEIESTPATLTMAA